MQLDGAKILLTGASRGIGAALLPLLEAEGAEVVAVARTPSERVERCDVSIPEEVAALAERTGPVDLLVNNAAVIHEPAPLWEVPAEEWRRVLDVNVLGTVETCRRYVPAMNQRGRGAIVNVSSTWGRVAAAEQAPYCASKFAVEALSSSLADEVAPGVAVVAVNPGVVDTDMLRTCFRGQTAGATHPEACAASLLRLLQALEPSWNGRSLDAASF